MLARSLFTAGLIVTLARVATVSAQTLVIPVGSTVTVSDSQDIHVPIDVRGSFLATGTGMINPWDVITVRDGALFDCGSEGWIRLNSGTSHLLGGELRAQRILIGGYGDSTPADAEVFEHSGGTFNVSWNVFLGSGAHYKLSGGTLITQTEDIGDFGTSYAIPAHFTQTGGTHIVTQTVIAGNIPGNYGQYTMGGGTFIAETFRVGNHESFDPSYAGYGRLVITNPSSSISVTAEMGFGYDSSFSAVPGSTIHLVGGTFTNYSTNAGSLSGLANLNLVVDAGTPPFPGSQVISGLEAASADLGPTMIGFDNNFAIDSLDIGGSSPAWAGLSNVVDNEPGSALNDAMYVRRLVLEAGSTLDLNGLNLYCQQFINLGGTINYDGGQLTVVPEPVSIAGMMMLAAALIRTRRPVEHRRSRRYSLPAIDEHTPG